MNVVLLQPRLRHDETADNVEQIRALLRDVSAELGPGDVVVLPERYELRVDRAAYESDVRTLAQELGCFVIGGSHRDTDVNSGVVSDPSGRLLGSYDKLRPYAVERQWVSPGSRLGEFVIAGRRVLVLICADFWFVDLILQAAAAPDLIVVPALSVTRSQEPDYSRALWRHLAVSRAYEFGAYVAISDWAHDSDLPVLAAAGVAGIADPSTRDPLRLFRALGAERCRIVTLDFAALETFRADRRARGFYWRTNNDTPL